MTSLVSSDRESGIRETIRARVYGYAERVMGLPSGRGQAGGDMASTLCLIAAILAGLIAAGRLIRGGIEGALIPGAICLIAAALALAL